MATTCVGLFGPCDNPADPEYLLEDPDGKGPPIPRCRRCAEVGDALLKKVFESAKRTKRLKELLDVAELIAERVNTKDRGEA